MLNAQTGMKAGDTLIIQFGINDGDSACPRHVGTALYKTYLVEMAQAAKERNARPIFVTQLSIKRRYSEADKLDAELTATAFERVKTKEAAKTDAKAGAGDEAADKDKGKAKTEKDRGAPDGAKGERR